MTDFNRLLNSISIISIDAPLLLFFELRFYCCSLVRKGLITNLRPRVNKCLISVFWSLFIFFFGYRLFFEEMSLVSGYRFLIFIDSLRDKGLNYMQTKHKFIKMQSLVEQILL